MSITTKHVFGAAAVLFACMQANAQTGAGNAASPTSGEHPVYGFGANVSESELERFVSPLPDGRGLPKGSGTVMQGEKVYAAQCVACHGANLEGGIGDRLIGGRGSLAVKQGGGAPVKTVESYWPYATTLFDYIKRAMPFTMPGSMSNDDVYAVTAYILSKASIVPTDAIMDAETLPKVVMPNHDGFHPANR